MQLTNKHLKKSMLAIILIAVVALPSGALAGTIKIAVTTDFQPAMEQLISAYNATAAGSNTRIQATYGASANLDAVIRANNNAPGYNLFLSDEDLFTPQLAADGFGTRNSSYAISYKVEGNIYTPIVRAGCLLYIGGPCGTIDNEALAFWMWITRSTDGQTIIRNWGYALP